ncbi:MAG: glycosyltransferase [Leptolyngbyaceae cyanobacterium MO_188.B28]|nr:glycosyltransferase [Leptolyngbyaceae cyanobacterium MO_188.B28]
MVYSHDAFGLGNIRRMLAICQHLIHTLSDISILVISGSPALHSLRLPTGIDYIKLPCLGRDQAGQLKAKFLDIQTDEMVKLRSRLILTAAASFKPDLLLVDKKPKGLKGELHETLNHLRIHSPQTKRVLLLRDILDTPEATVSQWRQNGYYDQAELLYDQLWVVGSPEVFDVRTEYDFSWRLAKKVRFCGYIRREAGLISRSEMRQTLGVAPDEPLVLVTSGGGGDGYRLVDAYLSGLESLPPNQRPKSLIISGPEMPSDQRQQLFERANALPKAYIQEFTDDLMSCMDAADLVVSMGGYNTVGEILTLRKSAIVVPRIQPVEEQWIRAQRMAKLDLFKVIHPDSLTPQGLINAVQEQLQQPDNVIPLFSRLDMNALPKITHLTSALLSHQPRQIALIHLRRSFSRILSLATAQ